MIPIDFKESNQVYGEDQPEYLPLPVHKTEKGQVISCWRLTFWERVKVLVTGKVWHSCQTFNYPLQPQFLTLNKWDLFEARQQKFRQPFIKHLWVLHLAWRKEL